MSGKRRTNTKPIEETTAKELVEEVGKPSVEEVNLTKEDIVEETPAKEKPKKAKTSAKGNLRLREKASTDGKIIELIPPESVVTVKGDAVDGWQEVELGNGKTGYVMAEYIEVL